MARRTVMYSRGGKKLYAVRDKSGKFKDIQQYARAHRMDIQRGSTKTEAAAKAKVATQMGTQVHAGDNYRRVVELIRKVAANRTILMVEHNLNVVADLSDTITVLARGAILAEGPYAEVSKNPRVLEAYVGTAEAA